MKRSVLNCCKIICLFALLTVLIATAHISSEAPTGFDTLTNGATDQETHDSDREQFEEPVTPEDGLGPLYNAPLVWIVTRTQ